MIIFNTNSHFLPYIYLKEVGRMYFWNLGVKGLVGYSLSFGVVLQPSQLLDPSFLQGPVFLAQLAILQGKGKEQRCPRSA